ncbi:phytoene desaturase family protein [Gracilimonas sediminicola]|uniref:Phytoene desaturase family protein n=1 Tax=Gracilimonas sediminicola TaxID=2952158 RepID=A0A9X2L5R8_9BACT|nr:phytoene desaturase family protein [Gracilimonas sediminicola]MCP9292861.1 phytoene desaturase family protein [Gracilimonas sediminicola]
MKISVIGAGLGGLSAACLLAAKGHQVTVFEKNENTGGKMNIIETDGYRFDTGPSLLTMPFILEKLFKECGADLNDYLSLEPLDPICRYFYPDGTVFNNYEDKEATKDEITAFAPQDADSYPEFLEYARSLYHKTADAFIFNPLFGFSDLKELDLLSFFGIDAFTTVSKRVDSSFESPYLRKFFKRFTTYNGSSPFLAPATLNVIPHVEINQGGYYVKDGLYKVAEALTTLAESLGVEFLFNAEITSIEVDQSKATGIKLRSGKKVESDLVISNSDTTETIAHLLPNDSISKRKRDKAKSIEPSCSGFVLMLGTDKKFEQLAHHNIFFSEDYEKEFKQIFEDRVMPDDPTIYIANTSYSDPHHAHEHGSNLFILINAPYLSDHYNWDEQAMSYGDKVIRELEQRGLEHLSEHIQFRKTITPNDFYQKYRSNKGSIYGTSSNSKFSAFLRPRNKSREIEKLYFVGGSTHPGGGIPLVVQSAFNAVELIERYEFD